MELRPNKKDVANAPAGMHSVEGCQWLKLRVQPSGVRTWLYMRRSGGRLVKQSLGRADVVTPSEALERVRNIASGREQAGAMSAATLGGIMAQWIDSGQRSPPMRRHQLYYVKVLGDLCKMRLASINRDAVQQWHKAASKARGESSANNALRAAKAAVNWAMAKRIATGDNPFRGIKANKVEPRSRYLFGAELETFRAGVASLSAKKQGKFRLFLEIMLHTGQRPGNICAMEWAELDLDRGEWTIPAGKYKSRRVHAVPLVASLVDRLKARRKSTPGRWVFPSDSKSGHSESFICQLRRLCAKLGIRNLTQHDLRRTVASSLINDGVPLQTVMAVLGHTSAQTSLIYARIADQSKRAALERL